MREATVFTTVSPGQVWAPGDPGAPSRVVVSVNKGEGGRLRVEYQRRGQVVTTELADFVSWVMSTRATVDGIGPFVEEVR